MSTAKKIPVAGKRERTRAQLIAAAMQVIGDKGVEAAAIQEIAAVAGVANGTFYNYFPSKEAILEAAAVGIGIEYCERISASYAHLPDAAERMAIGGRRYQVLALEQPALARFLISIAGFSQVWDQQVTPYAKADLTLGVRQGRFHIASTAAALDLIKGTNLAGIQRVLAGEAGRGHASAIAATVLRGLGMTPEEADEIAKRPLPPLPPPREA